MTSVFLKFKLFFKENLIKTQLKEDPKTTLNRSL